MFEDSISQCKEVHPQPFHREVSFHRLLERTLNQNNIVLQSLCGKQNLVTTNLEIELMHSQ